jgi:hypothetical protein
MIVADLFVYVIQDVIVVFTGDTLHEYVGSCSLLVQLVFD